MALSKGNMMSVRDDAIILDATLRDGGLVNDFFFTDDFVKKLYKANIDAGIDYMEFGYRADKKQFDETKFGKWKFSTDDDIREIIGDAKSDMKIAIMADVGRCNYKEDIKDAANSPVDMVRVATYINQIPEAIAMIEDANAKGYETTCNIMAVSKCQESDIKQALAMLSKTPAKAIYVVDSYGSLYPEQINTIVSLYAKELKASGKLVGIHAHNNQQCAFANTIEALRVGASLLDATVMGMGRGAGNCASEALLGFLKNSKYQLVPILNFLQNEMIPMTESGIEWGYNIPYLLTGLTNEHPRDAIAATKEKNNNFADFYNMLLD